MLEAEHWTNEERKVISIGGAREGVGRGEMIERLMDSVE